MKLPRRFEIWSDLQCAGGTRLAQIPELLRGAAGTGASASESRVVGDDHQLTILLPQTSDAAAQLLEGRVIRVDYDDTPTYDEWRIVKIDEAREVTQGGTALLTVTAYWPLVDWGTRGGVVQRTEADGTRTADFDLTALTPTQHLTNYIRATLWAEGLTWFDLGTISPTIPVDLSYRGDTPRAALGKLQDALAQLSGNSCELQLRRNGTTGYLLDLVAQVGSGATAFALSFGLNSPWLRRHRSTLDQATRVVPLGTPVADRRPTLARARWQVTAVAGTVVTLADPAGGDGPVGFDDQLNGYYLRTVGGTLTAISASSASAQTVTVASATGISVNDLVEVRADSSGTELTALEAPAAKATYGLATKVLDRPDLPGTVNLLTNPVMRTYTGSSSPPDGWTAVGSPVSTKRTDPSQWQSGGAAWRLQTAADGEGGDTPYAAISPTADAPTFPGLASFWIDSGAVRCELIAAKDPVSVSSVTRSSGTVTVTTSSAHGLATGDRVELLGASPSDYNGIWQVTVTDTTHFTFTIYTTPTSPATGTITCAWVRRIPEGTQGRARSDLTKAWTQLQITDQVTDLHSLGATRIKVRLVQDGTGTADFTWDAAQVTQGSSQEPLVEGAGPTKLWQAANATLRQQCLPDVSYEAALLDLVALDPTVWTNDLTLGGPVTVTDPLLTAPVSTRLLGYQRSLLAPEVGTLTLATRYQLLTQALATAKLAPKPTNGGTTFTQLDVTPVITPVSGDATAAAVRLAANVPDATIYYWLGDLGTVPPALSAVQAGAPDDTHWGTYAGPFQVNRDQSVDVQLMTYASYKGQVSLARAARIEHLKAASATLSLGEPSGGTLSVGWTPDIDCVAVDLYYAKTNWPTTGAHGTTDPLDLTALVRRQLQVTADGLGYDASGNLVRGGTSVASVATGLLAGDVARVILIPYDRDGVPGDRVTASRSMSGAVSPAMDSVVASRTTDGSGCSIATGATISCALSPNAAVSDATHDLKLYYNGILGATEANPHSAGTTTFKVPYYRTAGKFDPTVSLAITYELIDTTAGNAVVDSGSAGTIEFTTSCPF